MSIMCAVFVPDGIVMAADSRQTVGLTPVIAKKQQAVEASVLNRMSSQQLQGEMLLQSDNAQKIVLLNKTNVGISACGIGLLNRKSISEYLHSFEKDCVNENDSVSTVARKLQDYAREFFPQINFFVCGYEDEEPFIYSVNKEIKRNNIEANGSLRYAASWSGEQTYITKLLNGNPPMLIDHIFMPLKDAVELAEFLIELTIKAQRFEMKVATCGGEVDILVLTKEKPYWYRHKLYNPKK